MTTIKEAYDASPPKAAGNVPGLQEVYDARVALEVLMRATHDNSAYMKLRTRVYEMLITERELVLEAANRRGKFGSMVQASHALDLARNAHAAFTSLAKLSPSWSGLVNENDNPRSKS